MEVIGCGRGHFYDPSEYSSCPQCAREQLGSKKKDFDYSSNNATELLKTSDFDDTEGIGPTESVDITPPEDTMDMLRTSELTLNQDMAHVSDSTEPDTVQGYAPTIPLSRRFYSEDTSNPTPFLPVVGWLVCIEGSSKGKDYRIHSQYNYIGRAHHMDICIPNDQYISANRAAILAYDDQEKHFYFSPGMGHNLVRVNGKMVMTAERLNAYDVLTIGKTKLLFVPLCGEKFDWGGE